jgi:hypothetical protein
LAVLGQNLAKVVFRRFILASDFQPRPFRRIGFSAVAHFAFFPNE